MLTLFAIPKPFIGKYTFIQENAIRSWLSLGAEVILFGNEQGMVEVSRKFGVTHLPIAKNIYGTPILSDAFMRARSFSKSKYLGYINCDIILLTDIKKIIAQIHPRKFLLVGQRRPLAVKKHIVDWSGWQEKIASELDKKKSKPILGSSDYFIYPRNTTFSMPQFAVGRLYWDRWFFYWAKQFHVPIINATNAICAVHQQHYAFPYAHGYSEKELGLEVRENLRLLGGKQYAFSIYDADWYMSIQGTLIKRKFTIAHLIRNVEIYVIIASKFSRFWQPWFSILQLGRKFVIRIRRLLE